MRRRLVVFIGALWLLAMALAAAAANRPGLGVTLGVVVRPVLPTGWSGALSCPQFRLRQLKSLRHCGS